MRNLILALWLATLTAMFGVAHAAEKHALIIANQNYIHGGQLNNPIPDSRALEETLTQAGFNVTVKRDLGYLAMREAISEFGLEHSETDDVAMLYFSGHGAEFAGQNYLIPVDAKLEDVRRARQEALTLTDVQNFMYRETSDEDRAAGRNANGLNIIVLDACRNNPYPARSRSAARGLGEVEGASGTLIWYAAQPGARASDGEEGEISPFASSFIEAVETSAGETVEETFKTMARLTLKATDGLQEPWQAGNILGSFRFRPELDGGGAKPVLLAEFDLDRRVEEFGQIEYPSHHIFADENDGYGTLYTRENKLGYDAGFSPKKYIRCADEDYARYGCFLAFRRIGAYRPNSEDVVLTIGAVKNRSGQSPIFDEPFSKPVPKLEIEITFVQNGERKTLVNAARASGRSIWEEQETVAHIYRSSHDPQPVPIVDAIESGALDGAILETMTVFELTDDGRKKHVSVSLRGEPFSFANDMRFRDFFDQFYGWTGTTEFLALFDEIKAGGSEEYFAAGNERDDTEFAKQRRIANYINSSETYPICQMAAAIINRHGKGRYTQQLIVDWLERERKVITAAADRGIFGCTTAATQLDCAFAPGTHALPKSWEEAAAKPKCVERVTDRRFVGINERHYLHGMRDLIPLEDLIIGYARDYTRDRWNRSEGNPNKQVSEIGETVHTRIHDAAWQHISERAERGGDVAEYYREFLVLFPRSEHAVMARQRYAERLATE